VPTGIRQVSHGNVDNRGSTVDGKPLNETNSVSFYSIDQFFKWINASLNRI